MAGLAIMRDFDRENSALGRSCEFAVTLDRLHSVFLHQKFKALSMFGDDFSLALLDRGPVQLARVHALNAEFLGVFQVIPELSVEQQRLRRDASHMQTGAAEKPVLFGECGLEAPLAGANGGGVPSRSAADDGYVINSF